MLSTRALKSKRAIQSDLLNKNQIKLVDTHRTSPCTFVMKEKHNAVRYSVFIIIIYEALNYGAGLYTYDFVDSL